MRNKTKKKIPRPHKKAAIFANWYRVGVVGLLAYAIARLPHFIQRLEYAVYREDEHRLDPWIAATFATFLIE